MDFIRVHIFLFDIFQVIFSAVTLFPVLFVRVFLPVYSVKFNFSCHTWSLLISTDLSMIFPSLSDYVSWFSVVLCRIIASCLLFILLVLVTRDRSYSAASVYKTLKDIHQF